MEHHTLMFVLEKHLGWPKVLGIILWRLWTFTANVMGSWSEICLSILIWTKSDPHRHHTNNCPITSGKCSFFPQTTHLERRWEGSREQVKLKWWWRRRVREVEMEPMNVVERDGEEWFEACRCFHILKEIDICVHSDADCTVRLQINNYNHKTPRDWLSIELSFFSLWQIWILLLQGSQMTLLSSVLWVCACMLVYLRVEGIQISLSQWTMGIIWSVCGQSCDRV